MGLYGGRAKYSVALRKLGIVEAPTTALCFIQLDYGKPSVARGLGERKLLWIAKLLRLQNLVVAGKAAHISLKGRS